jgi:hypothetical protein
VQRHPRDVACAEPAIAEQSPDQFTPDHTGGAENQNMQNVLLFVLTCLILRSIAKAMRLEGWLLNAQTVILRDARQVRAPQDEVFAPITL